MGDHRIGDIHDLFVVLGISEYFGVGSGALAAGGETVYVGVHEGIEGVDWPHGVEVDPVDYRIAAAKVLLDEVTPIAPDVMNGVDGVVEGGHADS